MKYLDICAGISAASVAWKPLGWKAVAYSEIDEFPSAILAHRFPETPNLGDMTRFKEWNIERPDVLMGGTPCQAFSIAGLRGGLADPRGNLMLVSTPAINNVLGTNLQNVAVAQPGQVLARALGPLAASISTPTLIPVYVGGY